MGRTRKPSSSSSADASGDEQHNAPQPLLPRVMGTAKGTAATSGDGADMRMWLCSSSILNPPQAFLCRAASQSRARQVIKYIIKR